MCMTTQKERALKGSRMILASRLHREEQKNNDHIGRNFFYIFKVPRIAVSILSVTLLFHKNIYETEKLFTWDKNVIFLKFSTCTIISLKIESLKVSKQCVFREKGRKFKKQFFRFSNQLKISLSIFPRKLN